MFLHEQGWELTIFVSTRKGDILLPSVIQPMELRVFLSRSHCALLRKQEGSCLQKVELTLSVCGCASSLNVNDLKHTGGIMALKKTNKTTTTKTTAPSQNKTTGTV